MKRLVLTLLTGSAVAIMGLSSCAQSPSSSGDMAKTLSVETESGELASGESANVAQSPAALTAENTASKELSAEQALISQPQLIKRADLVLSVDSVEESFETVRQTVADQQGDLLSLNDFGDRQRQITAELRVPQQNLDATLDGLTKIGTVRSRTLSTEDVSSQLVDIQARLANARRSEAALQEIMSRSGEIADVLEVSRELSNVRQSIEQMEAQKQNWQAQVRYSTINLSLQSAIAIAPIKPAFSRQLSNSWEAATSAVGDLTTDLLQLGLWMLAFSPYIFVILCGAVAVRKVRRMARNSS